MNKKIDPQNTKRTIWLQLRAGDLTLSRTSVKEERDTEVSIYGTSNDCEGEILVWFEIIPEEEWEQLHQCDDFHRVRFVPLSLFVPPFIVFSKLIFPQALGMRSIDISMYG